MKGLHKKYIIQKTDGTPIDSKADYFVLRLDTDSAAREAMLKYADAIRSDNKQLAEDIENKVWGYAGEK